MGRRVLSFALLVFCLAFSGCEKSDTKTRAENNNRARNSNRARELTASTPLPTPFIPKDGNYDARGRVIKVYPETDSIEIDHEAIEGLMPKMQMIFFVKDKSLLKGLEAGDPVDFVIEYKHPAEVITSIKKAK